MRRLICYLLYRVIWLACQVWMAAEALLNGFLRYVYIPIFHANITPSKIIKDLSTLEKKPQEELTMAFEVRSSRRSDLQSSASKILRFGRIVEEAISPSVFNCYIDTSFLSDSEADELDLFLSTLLKSQNSKLKILHSKDFNYREKISSDKAKTTPLVIVFSSYPSVLGLHPSYLVGAEIAFRPPLLSSTDYDLFSSFRDYAASEQRKGK